MKEGFQVRAVVRRPEAARKVLPLEVELVKGDIVDPASLSQALAGQDAVYINLMSVDPKVRFSPERDGTRAIVLAARKVGIKRLMKISGMSMTRDARWWHAQHKCDAKDAIIASGIPYTIFDPTFFMESLILFVRGQKVTLVGSPPPVHWIAGDDFGGQVAAALRSPKALNRVYPVQGPESLTFRAAAERFVKVFDTSLKISSVPIGLMKVIGLFSVEARFVADLINHFSQHPEVFEARGTWAELGEPRMRIEDWVAYAKETGDLAGHKKG